jgi:hypothetical protein
MRYFLALVLLPALACAHPPPAPPPAPTPILVVSCATACARQRALHCTTSLPSPGGASCEDICQNTLDGPDELRWPILCFTSATACDTCTVRGNN